MWLVTYRHLGFLCRTRLDAVALCALLVRFGAPAEQVDWSRYDESADGDDYRIWPG
jgi:hypothetical protein